MNRSPATAARPIEARVAVPGSADSYSIKRAKRLTFLGIGRELVYGGIANGPGDNGSDGVATLVMESWIEERLKAERRLTGADRYDEVWEGTYMMTPMPNVEHQRLVSLLTAILVERVVSQGRGEVYAGVNLAASGPDWEHDYRVPDVAVFLYQGNAENCGTHWKGPADFLIEITSPGDATREKLPFYSRLGVRELLVIERLPWSLELFRHQPQGLALAGRVTADSGQALSCQTVGLEFRLLPGQPRPAIRVNGTPGGQEWTLD